MNFLRQGFQSYRLTDNHAEMTENIYHAASRVVKNKIIFFIVSKTNTGVIVYVILSSSKFINIYTLIIYVVFFIRYENFKKTYRCNT